MYLRELILLMPSGVVSSCEGFDSIRLIDDFWRAKLDSFDSF